MITNVVSNLHPSSFILHPFIVFHPSSIFGVYTYDLIRMVVQSVGTRCIASAKDACREQRSRDVHIWRLQAKNA